MDTLQQDDIQQASVSKPKSYPEFDDGDVVIISPTGRKWKLHSMVLSNASPRLKELFNSTEPAKLSKKDRADGKTVRWTLLMCTEPMAHEIDPEDVIFKWFMPWRPNGKNPILLPGNINGLGVKEGYNKIYDNLFRCIYSLDPSFTNDTDGDGEGNMYIWDCTKLLQAAVFLDSVHKVRVVIETHLLRLNQLLWLHISHRPEGWVHLAARLESPLLFREAMLHIVGKFHLKSGVDESMLKRTAFGDTGLKVWNLIVQKARELMKLKLNIERHLLAYYPARMVHKDDEGEMIPGRAEYASDIYLWIALSLFRQYVSTSYALNMHHGAVDGGLSFYRTLGSADATYLRGETLGRFHKCFDMSAKGKACMLAAVETIKTDMRPIVAPLLIDRSQATRDPQAPRLRHLTCTEIADHELPWYRPPPEANVAQGDADMADA